MPKLIKWDESRNDWIMFSVENTDKLNNKDASYYASAEVLNSSLNKNENEHNVINNVIDNIDTQLSKLQNESLSPTYGNYQIVYNKIEDTLEVHYTGGMADE